MNPIRRLAAVLHRRDTITFCDRCGQVCDSACRANAILDQARSSAYHLPRI